MSRSKRHASSLRGTVRNAITAGFGLIIAILAANAILLWSNIATLDRNQERVAYINEVIYDLSVLMSTVKDAETGQRGYLLTGVDAYLEPYRTATSQIDSRIDDLRRRIGNDSPWSNDFSNLVGVIEQRLDRLAEVIKLRDAKGQEAALESIRNGVGRRDMEKIRAIIARIIESAKVEQAVRAEETQQSSDAVDRAFAFATVLNLALVSLGFFLIRNYMERQAESAWVKSAQAEVAKATRGDPTFNVLAENTLSSFAAQMNIQLGTFYALTDREWLVPIGAYGHDKAIQDIKRVRLTEGLIGEAARTGKVMHVTNVPAGYVKVSSSLGSNEPRELLIMPVTHEEAVRGVIELATFGEFTAHDKELIEATADMLGLSIVTAATRAHLQNLLEETQRQAEELQAQQEELRVSNEELEEQTRALTATKERLQIQQEELRQTNEELEQQAQALETQKKVLKEKNAELELAKRELETKARELELTSQYKSEFLANISHELRTPLNSILILSTLLGENRDGNLNEKQVEFTRTINNSGNDLLNLINDILDLSKVEAGKVELHFEPTSLAAITQGIEQTFRPMAEKRGLNFAITSDPGLPMELVTDKQRLNQILKNFLSNAFKFTEAGRVTLSMGRPSEELKAATGFHDAGGIVFTVADTGIGISEDKLQKIFDAFQQADSSVNRKYGGTGLGLTISRELANLLGGAIHVESRVGEGSRFSLVIPVGAPLSTRAAPKPEPRPLARERRPAVSVAKVSEPPRRGAESEPRVLARHIDDDRDGLTGGDRVILVVEDDPSFAETLTALAREAGFKVMAAADADSAVGLIGARQPDAIVLDLKLPGRSGLSLLEQLKDDLATRHIPIHVISGMDYSKNALRMGAIGYLVKPADTAALRRAFARIETVISKKLKRVLIVEDDQVQREAICELLAGEDIECDGVGMAREAIERLAKQTYDCMILDLRLPDVSGFELLESMDSDENVSRPPIVVYTGQELTRGEEERLRRYSESIIIKGAKSPERLLDEVSLFLHRVESDIPSDKQAMLRQLRDSGAEFAGKRVLLVDDDLRNVFALMNALESKGLKVAIARNGREALEMVAEDSDIELVLMDIMMPEMDGFEAMERIRRMPNRTKLPIIALTAKAMKGDQDRCLAAGANDYLPKPINLEQLFTLIKVWLPADDGIHT